LFPETGPVSGTHKENQKLKQYVQQLEDENNLLKLKFEILLDMVHDMMLYDISDWRTDKKSIMYCIHSSNNLNLTFCIIFLYHAQNILMGRRAWHKGGDSPNQLRDILQSPCMCEYSSKNSTFN
jgi:hypothetical protein